MLASSTMITNFSTQEEIIKKLRSIAKIHSFDVVHRISSVFYDVLKISFYALQRKIEGLRERPTGPVVLSTNEITKLFKLIHYHHSQNHIHLVSNELTECFGRNFIEADALSYFEKKVEGNISDKFGRQIFVSLDDGIKFMYKNQDTGKHEIDSKYYLPYRGKRLPWIQHTLKNSKNIYTRTDGSDQELMYVNQYDLPDYDGQGSKCFWIVILRRYKKDRVGPFKFKTAFAIFKYNNFLKRIERYRPITETKQN